MTMSRQIREDKPEANNRRANKFVRLFENGGEKYAELLGRCFIEITDYLTRQHFPYCARDSVGLVTFSAETIDCENKYDYCSAVSEDVFGGDATASLKVPQWEKIQVRLMRSYNDIKRTDRSHLPVPEQFSAGFLCASSRRSAFVPDQTLLCEAEENGEEGSSCSERRGHISIY